MAGSHAIVSLLCFLLSGLLQAAVIHVPADQPTIGAAMDAASNGDTILLADGTYTGTDNKQVYFQGKAVTVASESGPENCIIDCGNDSRAFLFSNGEGEDSMLDGLTLINSAPYHAVFIVASASPTVRNCIIKNNPGGGISCYGPAVIRNNSIVNNSDSGILCGSNASPLIEDNLIDGNTGGRGIACYNNSHPLIRNNTITNNSGGISCDNSFAHITGNSIKTNTAGWDGGGVYCENGAPSITDNLIRGNQATHGGGIYCDGSAALIHNNRIRGNVASSFGGGCCFSWSSDPDLANCEITGNSADYGGGVYASRSTSLIRSCSICGNTSVQEGGGFISTAENTSTTMVNCILWSNQSFYGNEISIRSDTELTIRYSDVQGGQAAVWVEAGGTLNWGTGMMDADPLFAWGPLGRYYLGQTTAGQPADSPCLDTGEGQAAGIAIATGGGTSWLNMMSTHTDHQGDSATADIGYHYLPSDYSTVEAAFTCQPGFVLLPSVTTMTVTLTNRLDGQVRRLAGRINIDLADGFTVAGWRAGYSNVNPLESRVVSWSQNLPALGSLTGTSVFHLAAEDVTPAPYNQPPNWPSGDQDQDSCEVTGVAP